MKTPEQRSMMTFMLYLNEGFEGGSTNFVDEKQELWKDPITQIYCAEESNILMRIVPKTGMAIVFRHHLLHEGQQLKSGVKYIMRSEVMHKKVSGSVIKDERERRAILMIQEAERLETDGQAKKSAELYQKAFRLWPKIEELYNNK